MTRPCLILGAMIALTVAQPACAAADTAAKIPEPASLSLLVLGAAGLILGRRLSRRR